jgi:hypothetical protein
MPISPHLRRKLQETLGADIADYLVTSIERMDASQGDTGELRHEMQLGFARIDARFQQVDARFQQTHDHWSDVLATNQAKIESLLEKGLREQTRFFFLAWSVFLAAIVGLYAK